MKPSVIKDRNSTTQIKTGRPSAASKPIGSENTNINAHYIGTGRKIDEAKVTLPPRPPSKVQYNVESNMTESKIFQAKKGLQLLKKKMDRNGMSRQKISSQIEKNHENDKPEPSFKKVPSNLANEGKNDKSVSQKRSSQQYRNTKTNQLSETPLNNAMKFGESKPIQEDERPIANSGNANFMEILEREMKKGGAVKPTSQPTQQKLASNRQTAPKIYDQNGDQIILERCSMGCNRMFNVNVLQKHEKNCFKVFQSKRKAFDSASHRLPEAQGVKPIKNIPKIEEKPKAKPLIPKWKQQSAALRAGLKLSKNKSLTKQQANAMKMECDSLIQCQFCGRKFAEQPAKKHIAFCEKKSKQISKNTTVPAKKR